MPLRIVLDTNVLLVSISERSSYHWIFRALIEERYELLVSSAILLEYEEIIGRKMSYAVAQDVNGVMIDNPAVIWIEPHYNWQLITADAEDDKFVDCAIAGQADGIVTYDGHFNALKAVDFPRVPVMTPEDFRSLLDARTAQ